MSSRSLVDGMLIEEGEDSIELDNWLPLDNDETEPSKSDKVEPFESDEMGLFMSCKEFDSDKSQSKPSTYGKPLDGSEIMKIFKSDGLDETGGLIWKALILPANFDKKFAESRELIMLDKKHYDAKKHCIKPRRGMLAVLENNFFSSLTRVHDDGKNYRWFFSGVLNGWPSLTCLELLKIEFITSLHSSVTHWDTNSCEGKKPSYPSSYLMTEVWAKLRAPGWSAHGWSQDSPGYCFWYQNINTAPRFTFGTNMIKAFEEDRLISGNPSSLCVKVHNIAHRYSKGSNEGLKDKFTYHTLSLLEWDHGEYCTVVELGFLNGISGRNGKSNWIEDKDEPNNSMCKCLPVEMIAPYKIYLPELRCTDVAAKSLDEHLAYMRRHDGHDNRFVDVNVSFSHEVRLSFNSQEHIAKYLINYIWRERTYSEIGDNCQTFVADFSAFLAGKKDVQPYHPVNRIAYLNRTHYFLYEGSMYEHH